MYTCSKCSLPIVVGGLTAEGDYIKIWLCECHKEGASIVAHAVAHLAGVGGIKL